MIVCPPSKRIANVIRTAFFIFFNSRHSIYTASPPLLWPLNNAARSQVHLSHCPWAHGELTPEQLQPQPQPKPSLSLPTLAPLPAFAGHSKEDVSVGEPPGV